MNNTYFITPLIYKDFNKFLINLNSLYATLVTLKLENRAYFVISFQSEQINEVNEISKKLKLYNKNIVLLFTSVRSVSAARNLALDFICQKAQLNDRVCFYDAGINFSQQFVNYLFNYTIAKNFDIIGAKALFALSDEYIDFNEIDIGTDREMFDLMGNPYIWRLSFKVSALVLTRFNEKLGPGDTTLYKSGEDVIYLRDLFVTRQNWFVHEINAKVFHAPRDGDISKYGLYATGQVSAIKSLLVDSDIPLTAKVNSFKRLLYFFVGSFRFLRIKKYHIFRLRLCALIKVPFRVVN